MTFEDERFLRNQLEWVRKRIDLLEQIEYRLKELREWAMNVTDKNITEQEREEVEVQVTDVQGKIHRLQFEMEWADAQMREGVAIQ